MSDFARGVRNVSRNRTRSLLVVLLVAVSVAVFVSLSQAGAATRAQAERLRADTATLISVTPTGQPAGGGSYAGLPQELVQHLARLPDVRRVEPYVRVQFWTGLSGGVVTGLRPGSPLRPAAMGSFIGGAPLVAGRNLTAADAATDNAVVGVEFAKRNRLTLGSRFTLPARTLRGRTGPARVRSLSGRVVAVYRTGVVFGDNQVFVPLQLAQRALAYQGKVTQIYVSAASANQVDAVTVALRRATGGNADVLAQRRAPSVSPARSPR